MNALPQIPESEAPPAVAAIYADLRAVSGVPVVNLIWRHFAALPGGVLDWAWAALRPVMASAELAEARARLAAAVPLPPLAPVNFRAPVGARIVIDAYARGNLTNLLTLTGLRLWLDGARPPAALTPSPIPRSAPKLRPLPRLDSLAPEVAASVRALAARHDGAGDSVVPSLYLALAPWPELIAALPCALAPLLAPDTLRATRTATANAAQAAALLPNPGPPPANIAEIRPALDRFTTLLIPDMVPVCLALQRLL